MVIVSNSSPIVALEHVGKLNLLREVLANPILIPPAVATELLGRRALPDWIRARQLKQPLAAHILSASLGAGESEAIALALEVGADEIVMDDGSARRLARLLGLQVVGTLGVLLQAKRLGLIPAVRPLLDALRPLPFHMKKSLYDALVSAAGE